MFSRLALLQMCFLADWREPRTPLLRFELEREQIGLAGRRRTWRKRRSGGKASAAGPSSSNNQTLYIPSTRASTFIPWPSPSNTPPPPLVRALSTVAYRIRPSPRLPELPAIARQNAPEARRRGSEQRSRTALRSPSANSHRHAQKHAPANVPGPCAPGTATITTPSIRATHPVVAVHQYFGGRK